MSEHKRILGLTGGVGSGKSMILSYLEERWNARILECDAIGRQLQKPGEECYQAMIELLGQGVTDENGELDRSGIARMVFQDGELLSKLNGIIHPAVKREVRRSVEQTEEDRLIVIESALLLEDDYGEICDEIWLVYAKPQVRRERLRLQRGYTDEKIDLIMAAQQPDDFYREHCRVVIDNSSDDRSCAFAQVDEALLKAGFIEG